MLTHWFHRNDHQEAKTSIAEINKNALRTQKSDVYQILCHIGMWSTSWKSNHHFADKITIETINNAIFTAIKIGSHCSSINTLRSGIVSKINLSNKFHNQSDAKIAMYVAITTFNVFVYQIIKL